MQGFVWDLGLTNHKLYTLCKNSWVMGGEVHVNMHSRHYRNMLTHDHGPRSSPFSPQRQTPHL